MAMPKGKKSESEEGPIAGQMVKGIAEGMSLKGKARQWTGVEGSGKAKSEDKQHPLQNTKDAYEKEKERGSLFQTEEGGEIELEREQTICRNKGGYCGEPRQEKGKGGREEMDVRRYCQER